MTEHEKVLVEDPYYGPHVEHEYEPKEFILEEPMHEVSRETFHGREVGYTYHEPHHKHGEYGYYVDEPLHGVRHGETYGPHHAEDEFETHFGEMRFDEYKDEKTHEHYIEPLVESAGYPFGEHHDFSYQSPTKHSREVEYELDPAGHVHMFEERPDFVSTFTQ